MIAYRPCATRSKRKELSRDRCAEIGGVRLKSGKDLATDMALSGAPSVVFDAVAIFASAEGVKPLLRTALRSIGFETVSSISKLLSVRQRRSLSSQRQALPMISTKA